MGTGTGSGDDMEVKSKCGIKPEKSDEMLQREKKLGESWDGTKAAEVTFI